jgi:hypothetical protein
MSLNHLVDTSTTETLNVRVNNLTVLGTQTGGAGGFPPLTEYTPTVYNISGGFVNVKFWYRQEGEWVKIYFNGSVITPSSGNTFQLVFDLPLGYPTVQTGDYLGMVSGGDVSGGVGDEGVVGFLGSDFGSNPQGAVALYLQKPSGAAYTAADTKNIGGYVLYKLVV